MELLARLRPRCARRATAAQPARCFHRVKLHHGVARDVLIMATLHGATSAQDAALGGQHALARAALRRTTASWRLCDAVRMLSGSTSRCVRGLQVHARSVRSGRARFRRGSVRWCLVSALVARVMLNAGCNFTKLRRAPLQAAQQQVSTRLQMHTERRVLRSVSRLCAMAALPLLWCLLQAR